MSKEINTLILGSGGREDALAWKLRQSPQAGQIYLAPGNGGTERLKNTSRVSVDPNDPKQVKEAIADLGVDYTIVGSEEPLVRGLTDSLRNDGIEVFGPSWEAAMLEGSKAWAVKFVEQYGIPHPQSAVFDNFPNAYDFLKNKPPWLRNGVVVKASGLAAGKGVFVTNSDEEAISALEEIFKRKIFGEAGREVVIQEKLTGFEVSTMAIVDGKGYLLLPDTEDHKQVFDNDQGPNTGGMGVLAPHKLVDQKLSLRIVNEIIQPTIKGMRKQGSPFSGLLYPGLMVTREGPKVLEYNVRFGDPET